MDGDKEKTCHVASARLCDKCELGYEPCPVCHERMPIEADRCNQCGQFHKGWRKYVSTSSTTLALITSLLAVVSTGGPVVYRLLHDESHTTVTFLNASRDGIVISATNSGVKPSVVRSAVLRFGEDAPAPDTALELTGSNNAVLPGQSVSLVLIARGIRFDERIHDEPELQAWLDTRSPQATIEYEVLESDEGVLRQEQIASGRLADFLAKHCCVRGLP